MRKEKVLGTTMSEERSFYRSPIVKRDGIIEPSREDLAKQMGMEILHLYLNPVFDYFKKTIPEEKSVTIRLRLVNGLFFELFTEPFLSQLHTYHPYSEAGLFISALEYILEIGHLCGINAARDLGGGFSFSKCLDEKSEQVQIVKEITSYREMDFKETLAKAHELKAK